MYWHFIIAIVHSFGLNYVSPTQGSFFLYYTDWTQILYTEECWPLHY